MKKRYSYSDFVTDALDKQKNSKIGLCLNCKKRYGDSVTGVCEKCTKNAMDWDF